MTGVHPWLPSVCCTVEMFSASAVDWHGAGVYTAMARKIDKDGNLIDPINAPWKTGGAFTTPPGWWHSHVNETDEDAWVLPVQDAGLFTYQVRIFYLHTLRMLAARCCKVVKLLDRMYVDRGLEAQCGLAAKYTGHLPTLAAVSHCSGSCQPLSCVYTEVSGH